MKADNRIKRRSKKAGLPPGTLVHIGDKKLEKVRITIIDYDEENFEQKKAHNVEECFQFKTKPTVTWINIDGLHDVELIEKIGKHYEIHHLILEDILNTGQRPKFEDLENYIFIVLRMLSYDEKAQLINSEQVSMVLGRNYVLSFQENVGDVFEQIRERIRNAKGRIRKMGCDYLLYSLLDAIVDSYFSILERLGERIESLEEQLVREPSNKILEQIHRLKRELISLRKSVWPLRELISGLERSESELIKQTTDVYLRDLYDHTIQVIDTVESYRDMVSGMLDIYLSSISNKMNAVMKVLTIIATIFIPLTFIAGIYGMNFDYMPELRWKFGYGGVLLVMVGIGVIMLVLFKRKKWL
jgi:magnesium transporter